MSPRPVWSLSEFHSKIQSQTNKSKKKKRKGEKKEKRGREEKRNRDAEKELGERASWEEEWEGKEKRKTRKFTS